MAIVAEVREVREEGFSKVEVLEVIPISAALMILYDTYTLENFRYRHTYRTNRRTFSRAPWLCSLTKTEPR